MRATWSIAILVTLGIIAATSAALLTVAFRVQPLRAAVPGEAPQVNVLIATRAIPALGLVEADAVSQKTMPPSEAPEHFLSDPAQAVGRVVAVPVIAGQAITKKVFPMEGSGQELAGLLPAGMRAVTVALSSHEALEGLVYPGCVVDVIAGFELTGTDEGRQALSRTLLEGVEVLAVESVTIGDATEQADAPQRVSGARRGLLVTLMVNSKQAEALQLVLGHGSISLAMRNPTDVDAMDEEPTMLSGGRLGTLADLFPPEPAAPAPVEEAVAPPAPAAPSRTVVVIRGTSAETVDFPELN
jgi:pilus assembly protein CpaB